MNTQTIERLKNTAKRTIKILELLEEEIPVQLIVEKLGVNRQLVDYYKNIINKK